VIFSKISFRKNELTNQLVAHPEHKQAILAEVNTLKGIVLSVYAKNYDEAINLMEARKNTLASRIMSA